MESSNSPRKRNNKADEKKEINTALESTLNESDLFSVPKWIEETNEKVSLYQAKVDGCPIELQEKLQQELLSALLRLRKLKKDHEALYNNADKLFQDTIDGGILTLKRLYAQVIQSVAEYKAFVKRELASDDLTLAPIDFDLSKLKNLLINMLCITCRPKRHH